MKIFTQNEKDQMMDELLTAVKVSITENRPVIVAVPDLDMAYLELWFATHECDYADENINGALNCYGTFNNDEWRVTLQEQA